MAKAKTTAFFCKECGAESSKWMGQCPACKAWNTLVEAPKTRDEAGAGRVNLGGNVGAAVMPMKLADIKGEDEARITTGFNELDNVLGGGIVPASLILVGGDPGIGKSTLLLQVCKNMDKLILFLLKILHKLDIYPSIPLYTFILFIST